MDRKRRVVFFVVGMALMSLMMACVSDRAKIRKEKAMTISDLAENWKNYDVYYAGSPGRPIGVLFDPKNDGFKLVGDQWTKVDDEGTLSSVIAAVAPGSNPSSITSRSNDQVIGYYSSTKYTSTTQYYGGHTYNPLAKEIDANTYKVELVRQNYPERNY
jgi:hypothetical protein